MVDLSQPGKALKVLAQRPLAASRAAVPTLLGGVATALPAAAPPSVRLTEISGDPALPVYQLDIGVPAGAAGPVPWTPPVAWTPFTAFTAGPPANAVTAGSPLQTWICRVSHTSGAVFDPAPWLPIGPDGSALSAATAAAVAATATAAVTINAVAGPLQTLSASAAARLAGLGLDYNFAANTYVATGASTALANADLIAALALAGLAYTCATPRNYWDGAGNLAQAAINTPAITRDSAAAVTPGANAGISCGPGSSNLALNPDWAGAVTGAAASGATIASNATTITLTNITGVSIATGTEFGMPYIDVTGTAGTGAANYQITFGASSGANSHAVTAGNTYKFWGYLRTIANANAFLSPVWRATSYTSGAVVVSGYVAVSPATSSKSVPVGLTRLISEGPDYVAPATAAVVRPFVQVSMNPSQTGTIRHYLWGIEPGAILTEPIGRQGTYPFTRAAAQLAITTASLPAGIWNPGAFTLAMSAAMKQGNGIMLKAGGADAYMQRVSPVLAGSLAATVALSAAPGLGSLDDGVMRDLSYARNGASATVLVAGGLPVAVNIPADLSAITLAPPFEMRVARLTIKPYAATGAELANPFATPLKVLDVEALAGSLYTYTAAGRTKIIDGAVWPVRSAGLMPDGRIRMTRARPFVTAEGPFLVSDDGKLSIPLGRQVHIIPTILAQSYLEGHYAQLAPLTRDPVAGGRAFMGRTTAAGTDVRLGSQRGGTGADGYINEATISGIEALVSRIATAAGFNAGETHETFLGRDLSRAFTVLDRGDGPIFLFVNFAFSGTRAVDHGPAPVAAQFGAGLTPPKGPYFDMDRALTRLVFLLQGQGLQVVVPFIPSMIGWNDQFDSANNFVSVYTTVAAALKAKIRLITGQPADPEILAVVHCTREAGAGSPSRTDLNHMTLALNGTITIAATAAALWPDFYSDGLHLTVTGEQLLGRYFANAALGKIYGEGFIGCRATFLRTAAAASVRRVGTQLQMDFDREAGNLIDMSAAMGNPSQGGFSFVENVGGNKPVTSWSVAGGTLNLNFATPVLTGTFGIMTAGVSSTFVAGGSNYPVNNLPRVAIADQASPPNFPVPCEIAVA